MTHAPTDSLRDTSAPDPLSIDVANNACRCVRRVPIAMAKRRLDPKKLLFAASVEQVRQFPDLLEQIRRLDELSQPLDAARGRRVTGIQRLFDAGGPHRNA